MLSDTEHDRWRLIEELFHEAAELPAAERSAFLASRCVDDVDLQHEAQSLLAAADRTLRILSDPVRETVDAISGGLTGQTVGPYRLIHLLGEGGMRKVFLANRADQQSDQAVAIKFMHAGQLAPRSMLLRFRAERQILADLCRQ